MNILLTQKFGNDILECTNNNRGDSPTCKIGDYGRFATLAGALGAGLDKSTLIMSGMGCLPASYFSINSLSVSPFFFSCRTVVFSFGIV